MVKEIKGTLAEHRDFLHMYPSLSHKACLSATLILLQSQIGEVRSGTTEIR